MQVRKLLIFLFGLVTIILVITTLASFVPRNNRISEGDFEGMIFHKIYAAEILNNTLVGDVTEDTYWTPTKEEISDLEMKLKDYVNEYAPGLSYQLANYKRLYYGSVRDEKKMIYMVGFCGQATVDWSSELISLGMTDCYFEAQFDVDEGRISYLWEISEKP